MVQWSRAVRLLAVFWVVIVLGAVLASAPSAFRTLRSAEDPRAMIAAWSLILLVLTLPVLLILVHMRSAEQIGVSDWIPKDLR